VLATTAARFAAVRSQEYRWTGERIYLNAASYGPLPERARAATEEFDRRRQRAELADPDFLESQVRARRAAARLVGAVETEIALVPNTQVGINLAAHIAAAQARGRRALIVSDREFPANIYPWLSLGRHGFDVRVIPTTQNGLPDEAALEEALQADDVAALALSFVQFSTGYRADVDRFGALCRARDIIFAVDAIQGVGAVPIDVHSANIDVLACGAQKWLCSPWGTGFTFIRADLCHTVEPYLPGWLSFTGSRDYTRLTEYRYELREDGERFEVGSLPFQSCVAFAEAAGLLLELGVDQIWEHIRTLQDQIIDWAAARENVEVTSDLRPDRRSGVLCLRPRNAAAAHAALLNARITCAFREGSIRLSPHFYNSGDEIARVLDVLERVCG
jgi:cysteine desulfurase / selenocysteine lyase